MPNVKKTALPAHEPGNATLSHETANSNNFNAAHPENYRQLQEPVLLYSGKTIIGEALGYVADNGRIQVNVSDYYQKEKKSIRPVLEYEHKKETPLEVDAGIIPVRVIIDLFNKHLVKINFSGQPDYLNTFIELADLQHPFTFLDSIDTDKQNDAITHGYYLKHIFLLIIKEGLLNDEYEFRKELQRCGIVPYNVKESFFELSESITTLSSGLLFGEYNEDLRSFLSYYYRLLKFFVALNDYLKEHKI